MTFSTSDAAVCWLRASSNSRMSRAIFVFWPAAEELRRCAVFGAPEVNVLWLRALTALPPVLTRRLIVAPEAQTRNGSNLRARSGRGRSLVEPMSALGHKRTFAVQNAMSALLPIADMCGALGDVRFVPEADIAPPPHFKTGGSETRAQRTKCDIAFAETTGRCAASAMAMPRPLAMQA